MHILAKLEGQNLGGSASTKDRIAKYMIEKAEQSRELTHSKTIIEATSSNTGIALAWLGRNKGYAVKQSAVTITRVTATISLNILNPLPTY
ncbi:MAG: pyridoxal-phosphate dependent enzyme, partial [Dehalococcoidales bacterium]|nr:pyridoxal-phosphate dependent enzyme [Dehalococcoidales bacterium]